jgi:GNAT superfamily N-acetyltransferase
MAVWAQVSFTYRSTGLWGVVRGAARKAVFPLVAYQRLLVLKAPLRVTGPVERGDVVCEVADRQRLRLLAEADWDDGQDIIRGWLEDGQDSRRRLVVAHDRRGIVGVCLYELDVLGLPGIVLRAPLRSHFVHFIGVHERARGRGIMADLLGCADRDAVSGGADWRLCLVAPHNHASLRGFTKSGAEHAGSVTVIRILGTPAFILPRWLRRER